MKGFKSSVVFRDSWFVCLFVCFFKAFKRPGVVTVVLFSELSQGTKILVVFLFKLQMRSAVFRVFSVALKLFFSEL